jgi:hypothetical protein
VACPFCVEPNFGIIYTPPPENLQHGGISMGSNKSAVGRFPSASSPRRPAGFTSFPSQSSRPSAMHMPSSSSQSSNSSRRKSVSHTDPDVVTVDTIHPDWQEKLNAVRATAARRANRRIVFRQVGDRLVPVGITSGRDRDPSATASEVEGATRRSRRDRAGRGEWGMSGPEYVTLLSNSRA